MYSIWWVRVGYLFALLLIASGAAHALAGWPELRQELLADGLRPDSAALGAAAAGWYFGSICMFVFALIFAVVTRAVAAGQPPRPLLRVPLLIGCGYLLFGVGGCVLRGVGAHFIAFATLGILFAAWSRLGINRSA